MYESENKLSVGNKMYVFVFQRGKQFPSVIFFLHMRPFYGTDVMFLPCP